MHVLVLVLVLVLVPVVAGCGDDTAIVDAGTDAPLDASPPPDAGAPLVAEAGPSIYAFVGDEVVLDGSATTGAVTFAWNFGDGRSTAPGPDPIARVVYAAPGRYRAVLTATDAAERSRTDGTTVTVTERLVFTPRQSNTVAVIPGERRVAVASSDSDEIAIFEWDEGGDVRLARRVATPDHPRTVTPWEGRLAVPCDGADLLALVDPASGDVEEVALPRGSRPYGAAPSGDALFVSLAGTGELARIEIVAGEARLVGRLAAIEDARGVSALPDGRLAVTRWRSPDARGEIAVVDPAGGPVEIWTLGFDPQASSDTEIGGVPSYLELVAMSPTGLEAAVPSLHANIAEGAFRDGVPLRFETTVRGVVSFLDVTAGEERFDDRHQFDNRGLAAAAVYSTRGDFLFIAMPGGRSIERIDALTGAHAGTILGAGFAPRGLAVSEDDRFLFVDAFLSRELGVYELSTPGALPAPVQRLPIPSAEPLAPEILRGKQLFNDSFDGRLSKDGYMACAHCHLEGSSDNRVWDFTDRGEGLRNTVSLLGRAGTGDGPLHWSANFDEVQDFENDIRNAFEGAGLLEDADWEATRDTFGPPKAGRSADLDALAAYVASLAAELPSPFRDADGSLSPAAERGRALFEDAARGCTGCHSGPRFTDSGFVSPGVPRLHDVGTLTEASGGRLGGDLSGLDTPTLVGLFHTAPYLHDGSAPTLRDVLRTRNPADLHGVTTDLTWDPLESTCRHASLSIL